jgi:hypothetical protein
MSPYSPSGSVTRRLPSRITGTATRSADAVWAKRENSLPQKQSTDQLPLPSTKPS